MKKIALSISIILFSFLAKSQDYKTAFGLRGGFSSGFTIKHFISESAALEGIVATRWKGFNLTGLYEIHKTLPTPRLNWYYGGGAHIGFWNGSRGNPWITGGESATIIGIDGIIGIEYNFEEIPLNLSLDWKPGFNLIGYTGFWADEFALSIRYTIK